MKVTLTLKYQPWPWSYLGKNCTLHIISWYFTFVQSFQTCNVTNHSRCLVSTCNTVVQYLTLNYDLDLEPTLVKHMHCTSTLHTWYLCSNWWTAPWGSKDIYWSRNTVILCLTLNYDLDLEPTLVKHTHCTSSHHTWHLWQVIYKSYQRFKRYRADTKYSHTKFNLEQWPWSSTDLGETNSLHIISSYFTFVRSYLKIPQGIQKI